MSAKIPSLLISMGAKMNEALFFISALVGAGLLSIIGYYTGKINERAAWDKKIKSGALVSREDSLKTALKWWKDKSITLAAVDATIKAGEVRWESPLMRGIDGVKE